MPSATNCRSPSAAAEEAEKQNNTQINELEDQIASLNAKWIRADQDYRFTKAEYDAEKYAYEEAVAHKASDTEKKKQKSDETGSSAR